MYSTVNNSNVPEYLLGMQISYTIFFLSKCPIFKYDFWEEKKTVFKYEFLVLFSYPWPAGVIQNSGGLKMDSEVNLQTPTWTLKRPIGMKE